MDATIDEAAARRPGLSLVVIKSVHSAIFLSIATCIAVVVVDGFRGTPLRRTGLAAAIVLAESAVFVCNRGTCPLTPLAERLGARRGSVLDIFLPHWFARHLPEISGPVAAVGLVLNLRALARRRRLGSAVAGS